MSGVGPHAWLGYALAYRGEFTEAISWGRHALRLAESGNRPGNLLAALGTLGLTLVEQGDHRGAIEALERGLHLCETWRFLDWSITVESALGLAWALAGRFEEALALQRHAEADEPHAPRASPPPGSSASARPPGWRAASTTPARRPSRDSGWPGHRRTRWGDPSPPAPGRCLILPERPDVGRSERFFLYPSSTLADELGMRPQVARRHFGLGLLFGGAGEPQSAEEHAATALAMFMEMGMSRWVEECERRGRP